MVTAADTLAELQWLSERISNQVRTVALGLLAVCWGLIVGQPPGVPIRGRSLVLVILITMSALVSDLLQYVIAYLNTRWHHRKLRTLNIAQDYDRTTILYRIRVALFWVKQGLVAAAFIMLLIAIIPVVFARD